uniref:Apple domain-containing protein n=1 Tax=Setaria digitata TaxID=48799 RepID=A0A915PC90_9BILA
MVRIRYIRKVECRKVMKRLLDEERSCYFDSFQNQSDSNCRRNLGDDPKRRSFCENRLSAFTVSDNTCFVSDSPLVYQDVTEEVCLKMCSGNRDNSGRTILCASLVYDYGTFVCTIYRSKSYPEGELKTEVAQGKRLFEKFCLNDNIPANCADSHFLKVDQSVIIGYAKNVSLARSIEACIEQCLMEHFQCKSAMYFYTEGECITNTESAMTQPTSFAREKNDKVIYIQNGCPAAIAWQKQLENPTAQAMGSLLTAIDKGMESANEQAERLNLATPVSWDSDDNMNNEKKEKETASATVISIINSSVEPHIVLKQWSDSEERMGNDSKEEQNGDSFSADSEKSVSSEEETTAVAVEETRKVQTESHTISLDKHPKPLKHAKLQQIKKKLVPKDNGENYLGKNSPLEVMPSPFQDENQHGEGLDSVAVLEKAEAQEPIKRLKIRTLNGFKDEGHFSEWSNWSPCRRPGERRIRRRKCYNLQKCVGALMEVNQCPKTVQKAELEFSET